MGGDPRAVANPEMGTKAPAPLANLAGRAVRFDGCVAPERQKQVVEDFLS